MKNNRLTFFFLSIMIALVSCSKDETKTEESFTSSTTTTSEIQTWVKLTAMTTDQEPQSNYVVMMFDEPVSPDEPLPEIIAQVTTNSDGLGYFNLKNIVTGSIPKTFYFEAFVPQGENYTWKSISHPDYEIKKGTKVTSSILVNP